jgi:hypothetical protein
LPTNWSASSRQRATCGSSRISFFAWRERRAVVGRDAAEAKRDAKTIQQKLDPWMRPSSTRRHLDTYERQRDRLRQELTLTQIDRENLVSEGSTFGPGWRATLTWTPKGCSGRTEHRKRKCRRTPFGDVGGWSSVVHSAFSARRRYPFRLSGASLAAGGVGG